MRSDPRALPPATKTAMCYSAREVGRMLAVDGRPLCAKTIRRYATRGVKVATRRGHNFASQQVAQELEARAASAKVVRLRGVETPRGLLFTAEAVERFLRTLRRGRVVTLGCGTQAQHTARTRGLGGNATPLPAGTRPRLRGYPGLPADWTGEHAERGTTSNTTSNTTQGCGAGVEAGRELGACAGTDAGAGLSGSSGD